MLATVREEIVKKSQIAPFHATIIVVVFVVVVVVVVVVRYRAFCGCSLLLLLLLLDTEPFVAVLRDGTVNEAVKQC